MSSSVSQRCKKEDQNFRYSLDVPLEISILRRNCYERIWVKTFTRNFLHNAINLKITRHESPLTEVHPLYIAVKKTNHQFSKNLLFRHLIWTAGDKHAIFTRISKVKNFMRQVSNQLWFLSIKTTDATAKISTPQTNPNLQSIKVKAKADPEMFLLAKNYRLWTFW